MSIKSMILLGTLVAGSIGIGWVSAAPKATKVDSPPASTLEQVPPDALDSVAESFISYEKIRALLAEDKAEAVSKEAELQAKVAGRAADHS